MANKSWQASRSHDNMATSYIVRIYRRRSEPEVMGMVEFPEQDKSQPFHNFEELRGILVSNKTGRTGRTKAKRVEHKGKAGDEH